jgi:hypothetical protein
MGAIGAAWALASRGAVWSAPGRAYLAPTGSGALLLGLVLALSVALVTIASTRLLVRRTRWARTLHGELRAILMGATFGRIVVWSSLSAIGEELLFRAALQPAIGLVPAALVFGAVHISPRGTGFAWPAWAALMGLVFGELFQASGHLLPCIVAHALINYENMQYICSFDPTPLDIRRLHAHERNARG